MGYNPNEPRDKDGKWTGGGGGAGGNHGVPHGRTKGGAKTFSAFNRHGKLISGITVPPNEKRSASSRPKSQSVKTHKAIPLAKTAKLLHTTPKAILNSVREARQLGYQSALHITIPSNGSTLSPREQAHNRMADAQSKAARLYHKRNPRY